MSVPLEAGQESGRRFFATTHRRIESSRFGNLLLLIPASLLLLPLLAFPLGPDGAMFFVSAQKILAGAAHYRDIVDVKPPVIYHLYALAITLFGSAEWSIRLLDLLLQIATCWVMIKICRRHSSGVLPALVATVAYALLYVGLGYQSTAQTESYIGLLGLSAWSVTRSNRIRSGFLIAGALCGVLFLLKFTLGAMLGVLILAEVVHSGDRPAKLLRHSLLMTAGFAAVALLLPIYLLLFDAWSGYANLQQFLEGYVALQISSSRSVIAYMIEGVTTFLPESYSLILLIASVAGIATTLLPRGWNELDRVAVARRRLLGFCTIATALLALTIIAEGKYFAYQFSRVFPFGVILAGFGVEAIWARSSEPSRPRRRRRVLLLALPLGAIGSIFSPLPHYLWHSVPLMMQIRGGTEAVDQYYSPDTTLYARTVLKKVGGFVRTHLKPEEKIVVLSSTAGLIYYHAGYVPDLPIYHSAFMLAPFAPQTWRDTVGGFIRNDRPRFIIVEHGDRHPMLTGSEKTSEDLLETLPGVDTTIQRHYRRVFLSGSYEILGRIEY